MPDRTPLEIGLCWGTLQNADFVALVEAAARHGFPTLSVRPDMVAHHLGGGESAVMVRRRLADAGVRVRVIDALSAGLPGMTASAAAPRATIPDRETCFRIAEIVECPIVNVCLYGGRPVPLARLAEAIGEAAREAARRGLELVLEFVPDTPIPDIASARAIVETCGEANCRILLDPWHLARSGGDVADVLALPAGMIGAFQLDDRTPPAPGAAYVPMSGRDLPGEGRLPLHELARAALDNNPSLTAEVEVFNDELRGLSIDAAAARVAASVSAWRRRSGGKHA